MMKWRTNEFELNRFEINGNVCDKPAMNIARTVYRSQTSKNEIQFSEINYKTTSEFWRIQIFDGEKRNSALNVFTFVLFCANIRKKKLPPAIWVTASGFRQTFIIFFFRFRLFRFVFSLATVFRSLTFTWKQKQKNDHRITWSQETKCNFRWQSERAHKNAMKTDRIENVISEAKSNTK